MNFLRLIRYRERMVQERKVQGTTVPGKERSTERMFHAGNERSRERKFQGTNSLENEYS